MTGILISNSFPQIFDLFHIFKEFSACPYVGILSYISDSTSCSKYCEDLQADHLSHPLLTYPALGSKPIPIKTTDIYCSTYFIYQRAGHNHLPCVFYVIFH